MLSGVELAAPEAAALGVADVPFDAALVRGRVGARGIGEATVVLAESVEVVLVVALPEVVAEDAALEIVELEPLGHDAEVLEGRADGGEERWDLLVGHELVVGAPAEAQCHHEHPGGRELAAALELDEAEVDLRLLPRREAHAAVGLGLVLPEACDVAADRLVAGVEPLVVHEVLVDLRGGKALLGLGLDDGDERLQLAGSRHRPVLLALTSRHLSPVPANGLWIEVEHLGDALGGHAVHDERADGREHGHWNHLSPLLLTWSW